MNRARIPVAVSEACVPNIGLRGRRRRIRNGILWLAVTGGLTALVLAGRLDRAFIAAVAVTALLAGLGFFQAREKT